jgi:nucleoside-diphosphate-sugar epimerase
MDQVKTALVLGASGGVGGEVARALLARGWRVRALARTPRAESGLDVEWVQGDAMLCADVVAAARGVALIVHAVNPPGYRNWDTLVLPMIDNTIAAAHDSGARILLPGTIYNYGAATAGPLREDTPQQPSSRKGALRVQMEERLHAAAAHGVRALVVRAGDFFGPRPGNNWFSQGLVKPGQPLRAITSPGTPGAGHAWAYLPDLAATMVRLVEQEARLGAFETFHFAGHWDDDGTRMAAAIRRAAGKPDLPVRRLPWWALRLLSPCVPLFREMLEMRYLWQRPFELDNAKLLRFLGSETHTPLDRAVGAALAGC